MLENQILKDMVAGKYPTKDIETPVGVFTVKYPTGDEEGRIERLKAVQFNGMSKSSFDIGFQNDVHVDCVLSVVISEYPEDYPDKFKGENINNYPLKEVKNSIIKEFNTFYKEVQEKLSGKPRK